jgi:hypothetical protein
MTLWIGMHKNGWNKYIPQGRNFHDRTVFSKFSIGKFETTVIILRKLVAGTGASGRGTGRIDDGPADRSKKVFSSALLNVKPVILGSIGRFIIEVSIGDGFWICNGKDGFVPFQGIGRSLDIDQYHIAESIGPADDHFSEPVFNGKPRQGIL